MNPNMNGMNGKLGMKDHYSYCWKEMSSNLWIINSIWADDRKRKQDNVESALGTSGSLDNIVLMIVWRIQSCSMIWGESNIIINRQAYHSYNQKIVWVVWG